MASSKAPQSPSSRRKMTRLAPPNMEKRKRQDSTTVSFATAERKKSVFMTKLRGISIKPEKSSTNGPVKVDYEKLLSEGYSEEELNEYKQVFSLFDTDGSGSIGTTELGNAMKSLGMTPKDDELEKLIQEVDQDGNGEIDFQEFCDVMKRMSTKGKVSWDEITKQCFEVFDRSGSGSITEEDFRTILRGLGNIQDEKVIQDIFSEFDVDGNNMIDYAEFSNMVKNYMTEEDIESFGNKSE